MTHLTRQQKRFIGRESIKAPVYSTFEGPSRHYRRHQYDVQNDVVNNRKRTPGRNVQYQLIPIFKGKLKKNRIIISWKTIRHIVPTQHMIKVQKLIMSNFKPKE